MKILSVKNFFLWDIYNNDKSEKTMLSHVQ